MKQYSPLKYTLIQQRSLFLIGLLLLSSPLFLWAQKTPLPWQTDVAPAWNRDQNNNRIDDLIEQLDPSETINIFVDLKVCPDLQSELLSELEGYSATGMAELNPHISFVCVEAVLVDDVINKIAQNPNIAMVEWAQLGEYDHDVSVRAIRARASGLYSPNTVEDAFPAIDGSGVNIAILDSGVDENHETFFTSLGASKYIVGLDATTCPATVGNPTDMIGHGTHVAGSALGSGGPSGNFRGVAPGSGLVEILVGQFAPDPLAVQRAISWVIDNRTTFNIRVINLSLGLGAPSNGLDAISQLTNYAVSQGIVVVISSGNSGSADIRAPGAASQAITVGSANDVGTVDTGDDAMSGFSTIGPRSSDGDTDLLDELKPEIVAPGHNISSAAYGTTNAYSVLSGTSMASPHVAGVAALIINQYPNINPGSLKDLLIRTAIDLDPTADLPGIDPVWNVDWGYGLVNAFAALNTSPNTDMQFPTPPYCCTSADLSLQAYPPVEGIANTIFAEVRNDGPNPAFGVKVDFGVYIFSSGPPDFYDIGTQVVNIPANTTVTVSQLWDAPQGSPSGDPHACLKAEIDYGLDTDYSNNIAQRNISITQTGGPCILTFQVYNTLTQPAEIVVDANLNMLPDGWEATIEPEAVFMEPNDCPQDVIVSFQAPSDALPGDLAEVEIFTKAQTFQGEIVLGGVTAQAIVPQPGSLGDVNGDQLANSTDALIILTREAGQQIPLDFPILCGDVNNDGVINSTDALIILSADAGINIPFELGGECMG